MRNIPYSGDVHAQGVVGSRELLQWWRDGILNILKNRGTLAACDQIRRAVSEFPHFSWLKFHLLEAETIARRQSWKPLSAHEILRIAEDADARLVRNGEHLVKILLESLHRLQVRLQGETPAAVDLWDEVKKGVFRPKDEMRLSDYIKRHFEVDIKERGIIANREVEIRRRTGGNPGERTDIHVDAITPRHAASGLDTITVIVEVKGCWNAGLFGDMRAQLAERYLQDNPSRHGLYVAGWFNCPQWDEDDHHRGLPKGYSIQELEKRLSEQALDLSASSLYTRATVLNVALR